MSRMDEQECIVASYIRTGSLELKQLSVCGSDEFGQESDSLRVPL